MMDIRRKTTYLSRGHDGRPSHNYSSFFQSAQKKYYNIDPNSGIHIVGPMFELTACIELKGDEEDFEARYPDSSLTFGPTICSFGLRYNDHNYALPSGLTPPSMAPHLMDLHLPRSKFDLKSNCSAKDLFSSKSGLKYSSDSDQVPKTNDKFTDRITTLSSKRTADLNESNDAKRQVSGSWYSRQSVDSDDNPSMESGLKDPLFNSRFGSQISGFEQMELRCEPELKVVEVPEELAVSPSQLSDLDSDLSDVEFSTKLMVSNTNGSYVQSSANTSDANWMNGTMWPELRCPCGGHLQSKSRLIRCPKCSTCQHVQCMESFYNVSLPQLSEGYVCTSCNGDSREFKHSTETAQIISNNDAGNSIDSKLISPEVEPSSLGDNSNVSTKLITSSEGSVGAQFVEVTADRAKRLGLITSTLKLEGTNSSSYSPTSWSCDSKPSVHTNFKDHEACNRPGLNSVDWDKLNEMSRSIKRHHGDTNVNLRMPSPPRASKRKQDLTSTSYNDADVTVPESPLERSSSNTALKTNSGDDLSSAGITPSTTPLNTPHKSIPSLPVTPNTTTSTPGGALTPCSDHSSSSGIDGSPRKPRHNDRPKARRVLFPDAHFGKRRFDARTNPLGAAWAKDYQEAENNIYTKGLLDCVNSRISANLERNHRIPPSCLTRSSLCRVVLFDHNDKGLEASIRLPVNEVVTEVRGHFLLMEEYEHYVDLVSEYNRYVMFYRAFGDRVVVVDASQYGNNARFIRRSCMANSRLEHYIVQNKLQIVIRTSMEVMPGTELTIPFDLDYRACRYPLDCACARSRCPVLKWRRKLLRNKVVPNLDYSKYIESQLRVLSKPLSQENPTNRSSYDPTNLTASPLIKNSSSQHLTLSPSTNFTLCSVQPISPHNYSKHTSGESITFSDHEEANLTSNRESDQTIVPETASTALEGNVEIPTQKSDIIKPTTVITDENRIPDTSKVDKSNTKPVSTRHKEQVSRKSQESVDEKLPFEPIITTRRQAAALKNVLR